MTCLHETEPLLDNKEVFIDLCKKCHKKLIYKKCRHSGRIDNKKYREEHIVDMLQNGDKLYKKYYGNK